MNKNQELGLPFGKMRKIRVAFDVDGTLRCNCTDKCMNANQRIVDAFNTLATFKNTDMYVWSGGGSAYADVMARHFGLDVKPSHCISKIGAPEMDIAFDDIQDTAIAKINLIVHEK